MDDLDRVLANYHSEDIDVRWQALGELAQLDDPRAIDLLLARLDDADPNLRAKAAEALGHKYDKRAVEPLLDLLRDVDAEVRTRAAEALGHIHDKRATRPLLQLLYDAEAEARAAAAKALGRYSGPRVIEQLIGSLLDHDPQVRCAAAASLGSLEATAANEPLIKVMQTDGDLEVREQAIKSLSYITPARDKTFDFVFSERDAVGRLMDLVEDDEEDERLIQTAIEALGQIGDRRAVEPLVVRLCNWDCDFGIRLEAVRALGRLGDRRVTPTLIAALRDPQPLLRPSAARALADLGDPDSVFDLERVAQAELGEVSRAAQVAARKIRYELTWQDFDQVTAYLHSPDEHERSRALEKLVGLADQPRAMDLILSVLESDDVFILVTAVEFLMTTAEARALPGLARVAQWSDENNLRGLAQMARDAARDIQDRLNGEVVEYEDVDEDDDDEDDDPAGML